MKTIKHKLHRYLPLTIRREAITTDFGDRLVAVGYELFINCLGLEITLPDRLDVPQSVQIVHRAFTDRRNYEKN